MSKLKVISEKYNDRDILHVDGQDLADAIKEITKEGKIPDNLRVITVPTDKYTTPLEDVLTADEIVDLLSAKACLRFKPDGLENEDYIIYYPCSGSGSSVNAEIRLFRIAVSPESGIYNLYAYVINDTSVSCEGVFNTEESINIGGTKLYKHEISLPGDSAIHIITTTSRAIANMQQLHQEFPKCCKMTYLNGSIPEEGLILSLYEDEIYYFSSDTEEKVTIDMTGVAFGTDQITPL